MKDTRSRNGGPTARMCFGLVAGVLALSGCARDNEPSTTHAANPEVESSTSALNGTVNLVGTCPTDWDFGAKVNRAMAILKDRLLTSTKRRDFEQCLLNGVLSMTLDLNMEDIVTRLGQNMPTRITCDPKVPQAMAGVCIDSESITMNPEFYRNQADIDVAATILHEIAHNKCLTHVDNERNSSFEFNMHVISNIESCLVSGEPRLGARDATRRISTLSPVGNTAGGSPGYYSRCGGSEFATGIAAKVFGDYAGRIDLLCNATNRHLPRTGGIGKAAGSSFPVIGIEVQVHPQYRFITAIRANFRGFGSPSGWLGTEDPAAPVYRRDCPIGSAVRAAQFREGSLTDSIQLVCEPGPGKIPPASVDDWYLPLYGQEVGETHEERCPGDTALVGLDGYFPTTGTAGIVGRLAGFCSEPVACTPSEDCAFRSVIGPKWFMIPGHGIDGYKHRTSQFPDQSFCGRNQVVVGLAFRSGTAIDAIAPRCADADAWLSGAAGVSIVQAPFVGGTGGYERNADCLRPSVVRGWRISVGAYNGDAGPLVRGLQPICGKTSPENEKLSPPTAVSAEFSASPLGEKLTWSAVSGASAYVVRWSADASGPFSDVNTIDGREILANRTYGYYAVAPKNDLGIWAQSASVPAMPAPPGQDAGASDTMPGDGGSGPEVPPTPCQGLCDNPVHIAINGSYQSGPLGSNAGCWEIAAPVAGGNCGNFVSPRVLDVNGVRQSCDMGNWPSLPPSRNGGYCIRASAGSYSWAFLTLW